MERTTGIELATPRPQYIRTEATTSFYHKRKINQEKGIQALPGAEPAHSSFRGLVGELGKNASIGCGRTKTFISACPQTGSARPLIPAELVSFLMLNFALNMPGFIRVVLQFILLHNRRFPRTSRSSRIPVAPKFFACQSGIRLVFSQLLRLCRNEKGTDLPQRQHGSALAVLD